MNRRKIENIKNLRVIYTARSEDSINEAAAKGFWPLIKVVTKNPKIYSKVNVYQNSITGAIKAHGDFRAPKWAEEFELNDEDFDVSNKKTESDWKEVTGWIYYYPHHFANPYAAYLIPKDIIIGERVFV